MRAQVPRNPGTIWVVLASLRSSPCVWVLRLGVCKTGFLHHSKSHSNGHSDWLQWPRCNWKTIWVIFRGWNRLLGPETCLPHLTGNTCSMWRPRPAVLELGVFLFHRVTAEHCRHGRQCSTVCSTALLLLRPEGQGGSPKLSSGLLSRPETL